jgi:hypothetical protein
MNRPLRLKGRKTFNNYFELQPFSKVAEKAARASSNSIHLTAGKSF